MTPEDKTKRTSIRQLALDQIEQYFQLSLDKIENLPPQVLNTLTSKAKLGMQYEREMGIGERAEERNTLRVLTLVAEDKKELRKLIKVSLPKYYPVSK